MKTKPVFWILLVLVTVVFLISPVVAAVPVASFISNASSGTIPLTVQFMDISLNTPTSWTWLFGDGGISSSQDPTHTYTTAGTYTVTLIATNTAGSNTITNAGIYYRNEGFIRAHRFLLDEYHIRDQYLLLFNSWTPRPTPRIHGYGPSGMGESPQVPTRYIPIQPRVRIPSHSLQQTLRAVTLLR